MEDTVEDPNAEERVCVQTSFGKPYSVERYYMLSEIEQKALHPIYLRDYTIHAESASGIGSTDGATALGSIESFELPPFIILYFLWNSSIYNNKTEAADRFRKKSVDGAIKKLKQLWERKQAKGPSPPTELLRFHIVVDMLVPSLTENGQDLRREKFEDHIAIAERLARSILLSESYTRTAQNIDEDSDAASASKKVETNIAGVTIGLADHPRAAPGLESCLETVSFGARDRRKYGKKGDSTSGKSCVGIVCDSIEDLIGFDEEGETDAVQDVMQSLTNAFLQTEQDADGDNESDKAVKISTPQRSPLEEFACEAHRHWRVHKAGLSDSPIGEENQMSDKFDSADDTFTIVVVMLLAIAIALFPWKN